VELSSIMRAACLLARSMESLLTSAAVFLTAVPQFLLASNWSVLHRSRRLDIVKNLFLFLIDYKK